MKKFMALKWILLVAVLMGLWSCGGGGADNSSSATDTGTLSLSLVDAPGDTYKAVYVTVGEVRVCIETGACGDDGQTDDCGCQWETIATLNQTFNLLELVNGVMAHLGQKDLASGTYHQMRLLLYEEADDSLNILDEAHPFSQYVIDTNDEAHEMRVPSGYQSGVKLVHPFEIIGGLTTELILDFDVARSVIKAGNSGNYILKPTIKVIGTHNKATVSGIVTTDDDPPVPLEAAMVTALYQDAEGNWHTGMSTLTDETGAYVLFLDLGGDGALDPKAYTIVAAADGYEPDCTTLTVAVDQTYPDTDFFLSAATMAAVTGTLTGTAPLTGDGVYPAEAPIVTVSFNRQVGGCILEPVETAFVQVTADDGQNTYDSEDGTFQYAYAIELPAGIYGVTATSEGLETQSASDFNTDLGVLNFDFTAPASI